MAGYISVIQYCRILYNVQKSAFYTKFTIIVGYSIILLLYSLICDRRQRKDEEQPEMQHHKLEQKEYQLCYYRFSQVYSPTENPRIKTWNYNIHTTNLSITINMK